jgi:hypothetical protein
LKKPDPTPGLVVRYDFLWKDEAKRGWQEGAKERPCAVVLSYQRTKDGELMAVLAPITHSRPEKGQAALPIPQKVGRYLRLDSDQSWIKLDELNVTLWNDPGIVPAEAGKQWEYGRLPQGLWQPAVDTIRTLAREKRVAMIDRARGDEGSHSQSKSRGERER